MAEIIPDALMIPPELQKHLDRFLESLGIANLRVVRAGGEVAGGLGITPMGHFFGGRRVGCAGITFVGMAPEWRGKGAATEMMAQTVRELHTLKYPLSSLFPATETLYRKSGYERALPRYVFELKTSDIKTRDRECELVFMKRGATKPFKEAYFRRARYANGNLDRHKSLWNWRHNPKHKKAHRYLVKHGKSIEGYVVYIHKENEHALWLTDLCILSARAGRRLLTFFSDHGTMAEKISWAGGQSDPIAGLLEEQYVKTTGFEEAMVRIISVPLSLQERGYPAGLETEAHFRIEDDLIPANNGDFLLGVSGGRGKVKKGGRGEIRIGIRALAQLYTGRHSPLDLAILGKLKASGKKIEELTPVFAGPAPWLPDQF